MSLFTKLTYGTKRREYETERLIHLRRKMLEFCVGGVAGLMALYLLLVATGRLGGRMYPWDGLWTLLICAISWGLLRRNSTLSISTAATLFLAGAAQPIGYATAFYGVNHPINALYLVIVIIAGLVVGGWFIPTWILAVCAVMGSVAISSSLNFEESDLIPFVPLADTIQSLLLWYVLFIFVGALTWFFSRTLERATQLARGQAIALTRSLRLLEGERSLDDFLGGTLTTIAEQLGAKYVTLFAHDKVSDQLIQRLFCVDGQVLTRDQMGTDALPPTPANEAPLWQEMVETRKSIVVSDPSNDLRLRFRARILADGIRSILLTPLISGGEAIGWFNINSTEQRAFSNDEIALASALAQQAALSMQLARYADQQRQSTLLQERNRLAREIHDTLAQGLTGIMLQLETAEDILQSPQEDSAVEVLPYLTRAKSTARQSLAEARRSVWALRPHTLEERTLAQAIRESIQALVAGANLQLTCEIAAELPALSNEAEIDLLRIAQEAITNVVKHAGAQTVRLQLYVEQNADDEQKIVMRINDDGHGFDSTVPLSSSALSNRNRGFGMTNMRERIKRHGGEVTIQSDSAGTLVEVTLTVSRAQKEI